MSIVSENGHDFKPINIMRSERFMAFYLLFLCIFFLHRYVRYFLVVICDKNVISCEKMAHFYVVIIGSFSRVQQQYCTAILSQHREKREFS